MIVEPAIEAWLTGHIKRDAVEHRMRQEGESRGFPIIGPLVGQACATLARAIQAKRVFEMGSGFGYSTLWFARAVGPRGEVTHTDGDEANTQAARRWLTDAGLAHRVRFVTGDALEALRAAKGPYDVVFIDVDKGDYPACWDLAKRRVRVGGLILADNTLWQAKVADATATDEWTEAVRMYVQKATSDPDFSSFVMPVRDGVCVSLRLQ